MSGAPPSAAGTARKQRAWRFGRSAEDFCAWWLRLKGYRVLARRLRTPAGELDMVVRRGMVVVFVEVKARRDPRDAAEALSPRQCRRIERAAEAFLQMRPELAALDVRFDVVWVSPGHRPRHLEDAWRPEA